MKNTMKKILLLVAVVVTAMLCFAFSASAETYSGNCGADGDNVKWVLYDDGELVISGSGNMGSYSSDTIPWYSVRSSITKVTIENDVPYICNNAFYGCDNLTTVNISDSVKFIGSNVFYNCTSLTSVTIGNGVTQIGDNAFYKCTSLRTIIIPENVTSIGKFAFKNCSSLDSITIGKGVNRIYCSFIGCSGLKSVYITDLAAWCNINFVNNDYSNPLSYAKKLYLNGKLINEFVIPDGVTKISDRAFYNCKNLTNITIPDSVTSIGSYAFYGCSDLKSVKIPNSTTIIDAAAFYNCTTLSSITIGEGVKNISGSTFYNCTSLSTVEIGRSVKTVGYNAFYNCRNLSDVYYAGTKNEWKNISFNSSGNDKLTGATIHYRSNINILGREFEDDLDYYSEYWNSSNYNADLANMMATFSKAVYDKDSISNVYTTLEFDTFDIYDYDGLFNPASCAYSIGFKISEYNNDIICLVTLRGTQNVSDWVGNFSLATIEDEKHIGFAYPANRVYNKIREMMQNNQASEKIKYFITGHSRGAAVANLLAVKLMENGVDSTNIYNYNFACPDVACKISFPTYNNIFNLCNREDPVPFLPGSLASTFTTPGSSWGKFGRTYWFTKDNEETLSPIEDHKMELYLEYFDQRLSLSDWDSSFMDKVDDISHWLIGWVTKILCPVDVVVTDVEGNKIASVIDGKVNYYDSIFGDVIILTDGDKKVIYVNGDRNFNVNLVGTDDGTMTYSVEKYNLINDNSEEIKSFVNIELQKGKEMYSPVSTAEKTEDIKLFVIEEQNGKEITSYEINADGSETELNHVYKSVINAPTCTESGFTTYTCSCGDTYTGDTVPANGHTDSEWIVDSDSTCVKEGSKHIECTVCEEVLKTEAIAKLPHNYSSVIKEATCETGGYTTYTCTCGDTYTGDKTPAKGHDYAEGVCKNCGESKVENCSCNCHRSGFMGIIWKILRFFYKLFGSNPVCECGMKHY